MTLSRKNAAGVIVAIFFIALSLLVFYLGHAMLQEDGATGGGFASPVFYPQFIAGIMLVVSLTLLVSSMMTKEQDEKMDPSTVTSMDGEKQSGVNNRKSISIVASLVVYTILIEYLGYLIVTPFLLIFLFRVLEVKSWVKIILLSIGITFTIYLFFSKAMDVLLPHGTLIGG